MQKNVFILLIARTKLSNEADREQLERLIKREYKDKQYMHGFLDGLLFEEYKLVSSVEFEKSHNNFMSTSKYLVYVLTIEEEND